MNNKLSRTAILVFSLLALCACPAALAQDVRGDLAKQLVEVLRLKDQFAEFKKACLSPANFGTPEKLVEKSPDYFSGIKPGHRKWPAIVKAWQKNQVAVCSVPTEEQALAISTKFYQERLTEGQMKAAVRFYSSPDGKALIQAGQQHTAVFYDAITKMRGELMATVTATYQKEINDIVTDK